MLLLDDGPEQTELVLCDLSQSQITTEAKLWLPLEANFPPDLPEVLPLLPVFSSPRRLAMRVLRA